jgi:stage III sporulation protein AF
MISFLSSWAEQIIVAVVIASIIEMVLPDNKNKKYVKMIIGIYILFTVIAPIVNDKDIFAMDNLDSLENYIENTTSSQKVNQSSMDNRLQELYVDELENNIKEKVEEEGYVVQKCTVDATLQGDESKQGINKITLKITRGDTKKENTVVNKVEINIGLDNQEQDDGDETVSEDEIQKLKNTLSEYYELEEEKWKIN